MERTCTTKSTSHKAEATNSPTSQFYAETVIPQLTESEKSRLMVIKREVGRGYALTMQDLRFLVEVIERCGL